MEIDGCPVSVLPYFHAYLLSFSSRQFLHCSRFSPFGQVPQPVTGRNVNAETMVPTPGVGHDYIHFLSETVNPATGSVSVSLKYPTPKGRGLSLPYVYTYNSSGLYHLGIDYTGIVKFLPSSQWNRSHVVWGTSSFTPPVPHCPTCTPPPGVQCNLATSFTFTDLSGTSHNLGLGVSNKSIPNSGPNDHCVMEAVIPNNGDGRVWAIFTSPTTTLNTVGNWTVGSSGGGQIVGNVGDFTVTDDQGTTYFFHGTCSYDNNEQICTDMPYQIEDRNGNLIAFNGNYTDTLGRALFGVQNGQTTVGGIAYPGATCTGSCPSTTTVNYLVNNAYRQNNSAYGRLRCPQDQNPGDLPVTGSQGAWSGIGLPTGQQYTFYLGGYNPDPTVPTNPYGLLNEIIYPDGGWVKYSWQMSSDYAQQGGFSGMGLDSNGNPTGSVFGGACVTRYKTPVLASRQVSYDGATVAQTQTFAYSSLTSGTL